MAESTGNQCNRATALCLAAMSFRGEGFDMAGVMMLADEYLRYIEDDDTTPIPRPDSIVSKVKR